ncbi:hypothetical protein GCM10022378_05910 [Salinicoccus jeotgali]|uniref:Septum formation initiator n=1 Tax=Salinicoccus jeotgali TaxID=381634 RepID=A0ABP7EKZ3_9STAP
MDREEALNRKFPTVYRGLDEREVREHLQAMQSEIDSRDEKIKQLEGMLDEKEENLNSFRTVETSINEAILTAQRAGDEAKRTAQARSEEIIRAADAERERIIDDALARARHISSQTEDMKRQSKIFRARFKMLVEAQLDLLQSDDWDYLLDFEKNQEHRVDDLEDKERNQE